MLRAVVGYLMSYYVLYTIVALHQPNKFNFSVLYNTARIMKMPVHTTAGNNKTNEKQQLWSLTAVFYIAYTITFKHKWITEWTRQCSKSKSFFGDILSRRRKKKRIAYRITFSYITTHLYTLVHCTPYILNMLCYSMNTKNHTNSSYWYGNKNEFQTMYQVI